MLSRLLAFTPEIDRLMPVAPAVAPRDDDIEAAAALLEGAAVGEAEQRLVELVGQDAAARRALRPPTWRALAALLGLAAGRVLRRRDSARVAAVGRLFGLELEGLSGEDQLFELARQFVRFARGAVHEAARLDLDAAVPPARVARAAAQAAARHLAPGLVPLLGAISGGRDPVVLDTPSPTRRAPAGFRPIEGARHA